MNKPVQEFIGGIFLVEFARRSIEVGYVPTYVGTHIERAEQPNLFWSLIALFCIGTVTAVYALLKSWVNERTKSASFDEIEDAKRAFLSGGISIPYSTAWSAPVVFGLFASWLFYVLVKGEPSPGSLFLGHWFTALLFFAVSSYVTGWSMAVSGSGNTLILKRLFSVAGNLSLPDTTGFVENGRLVLQNANAEYKIPLRRLSPANRAIVRAAFLSNDPLR